MKCIIIMILFVVLWRGKRKFMTSYCSSICFVLTLKVKLCEVRMISNISMSTGLYIVTFLTASPEMHQKQMTSKEN